MATKSSVGNLSKEDSTGELEVEASDVIVSTVKDLDFVGCE
jgi:hypothetical protein